MGLRKSANGVLWKSRDRVRRHSTDITMHKICNDLDFIHICTSSSHLKGWHEGRSNEGDVRILQFPG
jgi:hypothetical protein